MKTNEIDPKEYVMSLLVEWIVQSDNLVWVWGFFGGQKQWIGGPGAQKQAVTFSSQQEAVEFARTLLAGACVVMRIV